MRPKTFSGKIELKAEDLSLVEKTTYVDRTTDPEGFLKLFNRTSKGLQERYNANTECIRLREADVQDLLHEIELTPYKNASDGYAAYRKLKIVLEDRRNAKKDNEMIEPLVTWINENKRVCDQLAQVQGKVAHKKEVIGNRQYMQKGILWEEQR